MTGGQAVISGQTCVYYRLSLLASSFSGGSDGSGHSRSVVTASVVTASVVTCSVFTGVVVTGSVFTGSVVTGSVVLGPIITGSVVQPQGLVYGLWCKEAVEAGGSFLLEKAGGFVLLEALSQLGRLEAWSYSSFFPETEAGMAADILAESSSYLDLGGGHSGP